MNNIAEYRVFIASPGGLEDIREAFRDELEHYNKMALKRGVLFTAVGWEETLLGARRAQSLINEDLKACDAFVLVLHDRWGSPPDKEKRYTSGCQEEFELATQCLADQDLPMADLLLFFRGPDPKMLADPGPQLKKVLKFRKEIEKGKKHLFSVFDQPDEFQRTLREHLAEWVLKHEQGKALGPSVPEAVAPESESLVEEESESNPVLDEAEKLANEGKLTEAETLFARAIVGEPDPDAINRYGIFLQRVGRLSLAEVMYERVLGLSETFGEVWRATAYGNLGWIYLTRGDLDQAEEMHRQALEIEEQLGNREGMASDYGNLGNIYFTRGDLDKAEEMQRQALEINEQIGNREGMANAYTNLGLIYKARGDLDQAEEMQRKALEINEQLGSRGAMAIDYGNPGVIYKTRGNLDKAEEMHRQALEINEDLGRREGMAANYGNLGVIYEARGDLDQAEEMQRQALEINEQIGTREGMAINYGNLGSIYFTRGDLDKAEELDRKALEIDEQLGRREGVAINHHNLGLIYKARGNHPKARAHWTQAKALYAEVGIPKKVEEVEALLASLDESD